MDSQTQRLLSLIFELSPSPHILDFGCGGLRLLNALLSLRGDQAWSYVGVDIVDTAREQPEALEHCLSFVAHRDRWSLTSVDQMKDRVEEFDLAVLMNVVHELSIADLAEATERIRRCLRPGGHAIVVDTAYLPEGEPRFVPIYPWEMEGLFGATLDLSYVSRSGVPVVVGVAKREELPVYHGRTGFLTRVFIQKRDLMARAAVGLGAADDEDDEDERKKLGLGEDSIFDFLYLNTVVTNLTYRVDELPLHLLCGREEYDLAGKAFLDFILGRFSDATLITLREIYDYLGESHSLLAIQASVHRCTQPQMPSLFMPLLSFEPEAEVIPSEVCDYMMDNFSTEDIGEVGFDAFLELAYAHWPGHGH